MYTRPDRRAGRGRTRTETPVKVFAKAHGLSVFTPAGLRNNPEERERMSAAKADVFVVVAYGRILPAEILNIPPLGVVNGPGMGSAARNRGTGHAARRRAAGGRDAGEAEE